MSHRGTRVELFEDRILLWSWSTPRLFRPPPTHFCCCNTCSETSRRSEIWSLDWAAHMQLIWRQRFFCSKVYRKKIVCDHGRGIIYFTSTWWDFHSHCSSSNPGPAAPLRQVADGTPELQILKTSFFTETQEAAAVHAGQSVDQRQAKTA